MSPLDVPTLPRPAVLEPFQWTNFKLRYPDSVGVAGDAPPISWTPDVARQIGGFNARVNPPGIIAKVDHRGVLDAWDVWPETGNCNDFAVTKRAELLKAGYPASVLLLEEVHIPGDPPKMNHLILNLRTDRGDIVLDNLTPALLSRNETGYTRVKIQSSSDPGVWTK